MSNSPEIGSRTRTRAIMEKYGIRTKKSFGQNFLTDLNVLKNIVEAAEITANDNVIEIGPGIGALTEQLAQAAGEVLALEIDQDLIPVLKEVLSPYDNVKVINQDVLQANLPALIKQEFKDPSRPIKVVANLPYYITSPILMNLLASPVEWATICVMMQKEVAQRLTAKPGTKQYGALTLAIEYQMRAKIAFDVSRKVFVPAPNVDSAIVVLTPRTEPLPVQPFDKQKLFGFIRGCFAHRRKSLWNNLQSVIGKDPAVKEKITTVLTQLGISPQIRPEKLTLEQFVELANALHHQKLL
ncbi:16S rRNA (adenine(1518)-N(6)/adenine(1519)-N(6))-dimethyltransferase RsmA [Limosilactobacillus agrestis]|uniref:Ribosomal RNA small subunit methyltransferase A n=1 Tax=Limosilactobacillus agrestis TaxID=2759748 RepID=A0A7W3UFN8_9LACO|nr:16S rRNA (adenine(1518)-N(6)/adenine(1519)-N(6))-dimethyltransferase RsmA [Limosilactobacillus agrestis]MBD5091566.1 16S rRNA (adenine(1518)-N(6)/adenine(1519)-N(6))-dimethyltransferase RsmA [Lactobacillus sp.]MBB1094684.1 16S rRNA (adenine(1518)-N(6)/adenine(1519)-N(6))-dimethyltransferase RsmA [Limosilactobacillus agrestis]MBB1098682.1 16S rRNA (adenine(1518)-N(6)/adenine(1519)-N(6))-dimethyltransferase RsmA [Limosilactobacillus agrestis]MCD7112245.1 16S rRNA (adenine(1518)-N(6)/adenine(15